MTYNSDYKWKLCTLLHEDLLRCEYYHISTQDHVVRTGNVRHRHATLDVKSCYLTLILWWTFYVQDHLRQSEIYSNHLKTFLIFRWTESVWVLFNSVFTFKINLTKPLSRLRILSRNKSFSAENSNNESKIWLIECAGWRCSVRGKWEMSKMES